MQTVSQLLDVKGRQVWSVPVDSTVFEALRLMAAKDVGALVVLDGEEVVGIMSERDYARRIALDAGLRHVYLGNVRDESANVFTFVSQLLVKLNAESKTLADAIANGAKDEQLKKDLTALHDRFHEIIGACREEKKKHQ